MFILGPDCSDVKEYLRWYGKASPDPPCCPRCGGRMRKHGHFRRQVIQASEIVEIPLYRAYCRACRATGVLYPVFLKPYARYESIVREKVMQAHFEAGESWVKATGETFSPSMAPQRGTLLRWAKCLAYKAAEANVIWASWLAKWEPHFDHRRLWPARTGPRAPVQLFFRYARRFINVLTTLTPGTGAFDGGIFVFLRGQPESAGMLL